VNNQVLPLRYDLQTGPLWSIVRQDQFFFNLRYREHGVDFGFYLWSAPSPDPTIETTGILRVTESKLYALATARPRFERKNHLGFRTQFYELFSKPVLEFFYETLSQDKTASLELSPFSFLRMGYLNTWSRSQLSPEDAAITVSSYSESLGYMEFYLESEEKKHSLEPMLRLEHHFKKTRTGSLVSPGLNYWISPQFQLYSRLNLLMGEALSYYGNWRSLDSIYLGLKFIW